MSKQSFITEYYSIMERSEREHAKTHPNCDPDCQLLHVLEERSRNGFAKNFGANLAADAVYDIALWGLRTLIK